MQNFIDVTILSVLQGVAEFLPISSSGHLVIGQHLLGINAPGMRLDTFLHLGTLLAIFVYYRKVVFSLLSGMFRRDLSSWKYIAKILISSVPAILIYVFFKEKIEGLFENAKMTGSLLMFTAAVLCITKYLPQGKKDISFKRAFYMGVAQAIALLPGVSRSGMTLTSSRMTHIEPEKAAEFSFLMSAPLIAGAAVLQTVKSFSESQANEISWPLTIYGLIVAAIIGYFSLAVLVKTLKSSKFWLFGVYCFVAGLLTLCFC